MGIRVHLLSVALVATLSSLAHADQPAPPPATKFSDFASEVKDATGEYYTGWVVDKLTTFKVSAKCTEAMIDKDNGAIHAATFYTRDIAELAKALTGDDWSAVESQNNSDRENNKKLVEPMIDAFKKQYSMTITVAGDCDAKMSSMWLKYWTTISSSLKTYVPAGKKVFVNLVVKPNVKALTATYDAKKATYTITGPRDIEKAGWSDAIEKAFKKNARGK